MYSGMNWKLKTENLPARYIGDIVDGAKKAELLKNLAFKEDIHLEQVIAVGDGANDLPMLNLAGLGIAFHAKPKVMENARQAISTIGLDAILYLMGFRDRELKVTIKVLTQRVRKSLIRKVRKVFFESAQSFIESAER